MNDSPLRVVIIGCGVIGRKRARAMPGGQLVACADTIEARAVELAAAIPGCRAYVSWRDMLAQTTCDIVVVSTPHSSLAEIVIAAIEHERNVLVEKPGRASQPGSSRWTRSHGHAACRCGSASIIATIVRSARLTSW